MTDFERRATVGVGADAAFEFLAEPAHLPAYVVGITLVEASAIDGDPNAEPEAGAPEPAPQAHFLADRKARRVEWGLPGSDYSGSAEVTSLMASMSTVTIRLHTRDGADSAAVNKALDQTVKNLQRQITGR